jgi:hypothetical protein
MFKNVINKYYKALTPIIEQLCKERMLFWNQELLVLQECFTGGSDRNQKFL